MQRFYAIVKVVYYLLTIFVGAFFLRGEVFFGSMYLQLLEYIIPGYLVLCGIMFGYILAQLIILNTEDETRYTSIQLKTFAFGTFVGV